MKQGYLLFVPAFSKHARQEATKLRNANILGICHL